MNGTGNEEGKSRLLVVHAMKQKGQRMERLNWQLPGVPL